MTDAKQMTAADMLAGLPGMIKNAVALRAYVRGPHTTYDPDDVAEWADDLVPDLSTVKAGLEELPTDETSLREFVRVYRDPAISPQTMGWDEAFGAYRRAIERATDTLAERSAVARFPRLESLEIALAALRFGLMAFGVPVVLAK